MNELLRRILALPPQASSIARELDYLHYTVLLSTMLGATGVAIVAGYFLVRYRAGHTPPGARPTAGEGGVGWGLSAGVFVMFLAFWFVGVRQYIKLRTPPRDSLEVYVTAKQWMWKFAYPEGHDSIDVLTVPAGQPVKLVMTSRDVIHSFYVPAFRVKQDVLPGRYTTLWFEATKPGEYPIYCAEFCGVSHSIMEGRVVVLPPDEYGAWLARHSRSDAGESLADRGKEVAVRNQCFSCHTIDGRNHIGPSWRGLYGATVTLDGGRRIVADEEYLTRSMMRPLDDVVDGYRPVMPTYEGTLSGPDTAALVEYIRALRDAPAAQGLDLPAAQDPRADLVGGGLANAGSGVNTGLLPSASGDQATGAAPSAASPQASDARPSVGAAFEPGAPPAPFNLTPAAPRGASEMNP